MKIECVSCGAQLVSTGKTSISINENIMMILKCPYCGRTDKVYSIGEVVNAEEGALAEYTPWMHAED